ncbi:hypothetical protein, partial [Desulfosporosinus sp. OT]|uniref:hypothetical protein n=1 Tax=Desulfosporosinus sp. OT TaxID=913865 RepID=UPI001300CA32
MPRQPAIHGAGLFSPSLASALTLNILVQVMVSGRSRTSCKNVNSCEDSVFGPPRHPDHPWSLKTKQQGQPMRETRKSFKRNHERIIFFNEVE